MSAGRAVLLGATLAAAAGCGSEALPAEDLPPADVAPRVPTLEATWNEFLPGGESICSRGTEYAFFVHPGTVNKLVVDFIGGGACWNEFTCSVADAIFTPDVEDVRRRIAERDADGIYNRDNPDNPFKDWFHVVVPYCTGDIHWGDAVVTYGEGAPDAVTIHHKGAVNARAVLDWVYENFEAPDQIFVTGCSAGSYGSALWAPHVMHHYPDARVVQFGDAGIGIVTDAFFEESFPSWNAEQAFPTFIPGLDPATVDVREMDTTDLYRLVGGAFPGQRVSEYTTAFDENQHFYYQAMGGGDVEEWSDKMFANLDAIAGRTPNFTSFVAPGEQHCIVPYGNFYTVEADGVRLVDWIRELLDGPLPHGIRCQGGECAAETP